MPVMEKAWMASPRPPRRLPPTVPSLARLCRHSRLRRSCQNRLADPIDILVGQIGMDRQRQYPPGQIL